MVGIFAQLSGTYMKYVKDSKEGQGRKSREERNVTRAKARGG